MGFSTSSSRCYRQLYVKSVLREIYRKLHFHKWHTSAFVLCGVEGGALKLSNRQVFMLDCLVLGHCTKCCLAPFFTVECHAEAQASAFYSNAGRINLCSLVKSKGV